MKEFFVGLIFVIAAGIFAGIGILLFPFLLIIGFVLRLFLIVILIIFAIWLLGKFIVYVWKAVEESSKKKSGKKT